MGLVYANIEIVNLRDVLHAEEGYIPESEIRRMDIRINVGSGAIMLATNASMKDRLGLRKQSTYVAQLADGSFLELDVVGPVKVHFGNRSSTTNALVLPDNAEPLLGAIPLEEMDLLVDPARNQLIFNPAHPNGPVVALR